MTRSSNRRSDSPPCHVLNFFYDEDDSCALTTLVHDFRFHIIADIERLKTKSAKGEHIEKQYKSLIKAVRDKNDEEADPAKFTRRKDAQNAELHQSPDSQDSGLGARDEVISDHEGDQDSAVDVNERHDQRHIKQIGIQDEGVVISSEDQQDPERALQNWMLAPFAEVFAELEPAEEDSSSQQSLQDWYGGPTYFYSLEISDGQLKVVEEESQDDLEERIRNLVPQMKLPKYLSDLDIPWRNAADLIVVSESDEPDPYHPSRVKFGDEVQFLKLVDSTQPQPTVRELKLLNRIESLGLHKKIRVPTVLGLVGYKDSKTDIMGFLMTDIDSPTPLTKMLDSDVIEEKRNKWAKETERMVKVLHENNIIWGDAKADNFMVDRHGDLWIIDFGGSYTEGWVDPELNETLEGDKMGTEKIVNALEDPESNAYDPDEETGVDQSSKPQPETKGSLSKKRSHPGDESDERISPSKKKRSS